MHAQRLRFAFIVFHLTLGLALLFASVRTVFHAASGHEVHVIALGAVEALGAALFLLPWTLAVGGTLLLLALGIATALHAATGEFRPDLLIYAAGTAFVMVHGSAWTPRRRGA